MTKFAGKTTKLKKSDKIKRRQAPGKSIQSRENQLTLLAYDLAERRLKQGTATSQEVVHFLKHGSVHAQLEKDKLAKENQLLEAKTEAIKSQKKVEELYSNAMKAFRTYSGQEEDENEED